MLHTLTLSPSLDLTFHVADFRTDDSNRATATFVAPGGKGINVSRVATRLGHPSVALGFLGGTTGLQVAQLLEQEGVRTWFVPINGNTRTNPIIQDLEGQQLRVSSRGPAVTERDVRALWDNIFALRAPDWLLVSGSKPDGVDEAFFSRVIRRAHGEGIRVIVDADGAELERAVEDGVDLIKPNRYELERLTGRSLASVQDVLDASRSVIARGVKGVAVSVGPEGALLVRADGAWRAVPPVVPVQSAVGSGDSLVAGLCVKLAEGAHPADALRFGVACGTATAMTPGTELCHVRDVLSVHAQVRVEEIGNA